MKKLFEIEWDDDWNVTTLLNAIMGISRVEDVRLIPEAPKEQPKENIPDNINLSGLPAGDSLALDLAKKINEILKFLRTKEAR